jgi:hypothetical protein
MTQHSRRTRPALRPLPDDALRIVASGERKDGAPTSDAKRRIRRFTNGILRDAAGGFVSALIGLCDFATFFLCCLPSIGLVE